MLNSIIFFVALSTTVYFFGSLIAWHAQKVAPENCKKDYTNRDILYINLTMVFSIVLWTILFYRLTN